MAIEIKPDQEIWVTTREGAEVTGYNSQYLEKLANKNSRLPEDERLIKIRKRSGLFTNSGCLICSTILTKSVTALTKIKK